MDTVAGIQKEQAGKDIPKRYVIAMPDFNLVTSITYSKYDKISSDENWHGSIFSLL